MHQINRTFFEETSLHTLTAEVSELTHGKQLNRQKGLPKRFVIQGVGNNNPFIATKVNRNSDDLVSVEYRQSLGCMKAVIFND